MAYNPRNDVAACWNPSHSEPQEEAEHFCSWLKTNIDLSASPSGCFITAHEEGDCRDQYPPYTLLRSIDPITLELNWSTPVEHYSFGLRQGFLLGLVGHSKISSCIVYDEVPPCDILYTTRYKPGNHNVIPPVRSTSVHH